MAILNLRKPICGVTVTAELSVYEGWFEKRYGIEEAEASEAPDWFENALNNGRITRTDRGFSVKSNMSCGTVTADVGDVIVHTQDGGLYVIDSELIETFFSKG